MRELRTIPRRLQPAVLIGMLMCLGIDGLAVRIDKYGPLLGCVCSQAAAATANASYGGFGSKNFVNSSQLSGGAGGRTFLDALVTDRCLQNGTISSVKYLCATTGTGKGMKIKVFRPNGANWDFVGESEKFMPTPGSIQTRKLTTPITSVRPGDAVAIWLAAAGSGANFTDISVTGNAGGAIPWIAEDAVGTNVSFPNTVNDLVLDLEVFGPAPVAAMTGDSIEAGHGTSYNSYMDGTGPAGDITSELGYQMRLISSAFTYQDYSAGSKDWSWVRLIAFPAMQSGTGVRSSGGLSNSEYWIHCGVNDIALGRSWASVEADLNAVYALAGSTPLFIDEILPDSNFSDANAALIRTFNANYAAWATGKSTVRIVQVWSALGQTRSSTGYGDDLNPAYDSGDHVHPSPAGAKVIANARIAARDSYYRRHGIKGPLPLVKLRSGAYTVAAAEISPSILRDIEALEPILNPISRFETLLPQK